jgi:hypothetical protein
MLHHPGPWYHKVLIRSVDRDSTSLRANSFFVSFQQPLVGTYVLRFATIPNSLYTVNASNNTFVLINTVGVPGGASVALPYGNYTLATLATQLQTSLNAVAAGHTVTGDAKTAKLTITSAVGISNITSVNTNKTLGLPVSGSVSFPVGVATTLPDPIFIGFPLSLGLIINESSDAGYVCGGAATNSQGTFVIPWLAAFGGYNFASSDVYMQSVQFHTATRRLQVTVVDPSTRNTVDLNNGEWEMQLERINPDITPTKHDTVWK